MLRIEMAYKIKSYITAYISRHSVHDLSGMTVCAAGVGLSEYGFWECERGRIVPYVGAWF